mgnify:FL=1|jgi:hypothetical protein
MKGQAYIVISSTKGTGSLVSGISGKALAFDFVKGGGRNAMPPSKGEGERTRESGLMHWLNVTPTEPQNLVWLVPQVGIDYQIDTSTNLKWQIK